MPLADQADQKVVRESVKEQLRDEENVRHKGRLQHDRHVRRVEQLDGVGTLLSSHPGRFDRQFNAEALQVNDNRKDDHSRGQVHHVRQVLTQQGFLNCAELVGTGEEEMEKGNESALKFRAYQLCSLGVIVILHNKSVYLCPCCTW